MRYRIYNIVVIGTIVSAMLAVLGLSFVTGPIDGDLTRIAGLPERQFGWHSRQPALDQEYLFDIAHSVEEWGKQYDVVVLGDSFTLRPHTSWASFLVALTGWSVIMFHHNEVTPHQILESDAFQSHPPALFVYQSAERLAVSRLAELNLPAGADSIPPAHKVHLPEVQRLDVDMEPVRRNTEYPSFRERISQNVHIAKVWLNRTVLGERSQTLLLPLQGNLDCVPFTSRNARHALIYRDDVEIRQNWRTQWEEAASSLVGLAETVESTSQTTFIPLIFPDKLSVYAQVLHPAPEHQASVIPSLARHLTMPRLDRAYHDALAGCIQDLYLPNNTHTGGTGSLLATRVFLDFIETAHRTRHIHQ